MTDPRTATAPPAPRRTAGRFALTALLLAALAAVAPPSAGQGAGARLAEAAAEAVHPFYARLFDDGVYALQQGDAEKAANDLRLAVFGMLEAPGELVRGLAYLSLAEAAAGEGELARDSLGRLISVADRFGARLDPPLPGDVAGRLDALIIAEVPEATLAGSAAFRHLAAEKFTRRLAALPRDQRRSALAEKAAAEPDEVRWTLALGELELDSGRTAEAARRAAEALAVAPDEPRAHCLAALAGAVSSCQAAVPSFERCPRSRSEIAVAAPWIACLVRLERWREAQTAVDSLPPALRAERPVARHLDRVARQVARLPAEGAPAPPPADATPDAAPPNAGPDGDAPATVPLPASARTDLERARELLAGATRQSQLAEPLRLAAAVADAHPGSAEAQHLAGEIAYRASHWEAAARYFRRGDEPQRPELRFYMAVSLFESGDRAAAAALLERALPGLPRSPFVNSYVERILGAGP